MLIEIINIYFLKTKLFHTEFVTERLFLFKNLFSKEGLRFANCGCANKPHVKWHYVKLPNAD